jgi:hypothetical protein
MTSAGREYAAGVVAARLGREPRDVIEAAIVLEAWTGTPAEPAMAAAGDIVPRGGGPLPVKGRVTSEEDDARRSSVVVEAIALVLSILAIAAWAGPLSRGLGPDVFAQAIRVALPIAVAIQWGLRSRYLSLDSGLALLARDGAIWCLLGVALALPLALVPQWGLTAAMLVAIWVSGTVMSRRGWGMVYALALIATAVALDRHAAPTLTLLALTAFALVLCVASVLNRREATDERPGSARRAAVAASLGGCVGVLLVADPSLGWGVHGVHPAIALIPSVIGSCWGGYYLWSLYEEVPRGLSGVPLDSASRPGLRGPAMSIYMGAMLRVVLATSVLSGVVIGIGPWTQGTDHWSIFVAFGVAALLSLQVGLLESLSRQRAALIAMAAALGVELSCRHLAALPVPGCALIAGAMTGLLVTLPPLMLLLARSGRVLATTLWIQ